MHAAPRIILAVVLALLLLVTATEESVTTLIWTVAAELLVQALTQRTRSDDDPRGPSDSPAS